jgi:hypothetical protein
MAARAIRGLDSIVPSYSTLWAAVGASTWPVTALGHAEACRSCPEWLGTVRPPGTHASLARGSIHINFVGRGENPLREVGWRGTGPLGVERGGEFGPRGRLSRDTLPWGRRGGERDPEVRRGEFSLEGSDKVVS